MRLGIYYQPGTNLGAFTNPKAKHFTGEETERFNSLNVQVHEECRIGSLLLSDISFCVY